MKYIREKNDKTFMSVFYVPIYKDKDNQVWIFKDKLKTEVDRSRIRNVIVIQIESPPQR